MIFAPPLFLAPLGHAWLQREWLSWSGWSSTPAHVITIAGPNTLDRGSAYSGYGGAFMRTVDVFMQVVSERGGIHVNGTAYGRAPTMMHHSNGQLILVNTP